jgi:hypothetical protein
VAAEGIKLVSASHLVAPKALRAWNERVDIITLSSGPTRSDLYVDFYFNETMPVQGLWLSGWALARKFAVALNIGTRGFWWWHLAQHVSRYYEFVEDLDQHERVEIDQQPRLVLNWGRNVLSETDLDLTLRCFVALPGPSDAERLAPYDYYIGGLNFWALNDVHWRCEIEIYGNFHESLKAMMAWVGDWSREGPFAQALSALLKRLVPDLADELYGRYIELGEAFERREPEGKAITLTDAASIKVLCDRYFLDVVMPRQLTERAQAQGSS